MVLTRVYILVLTQPMTVPVQPLKRMAPFKKPSCKQFDLHLLQEELLSVEVEERKRTATVWSPHDLRVDLQEEAGQDHPCLAMWMAATTLV